MRQVLIDIYGMPIFGYGFMLFLTFVVAYWLVGWRAEKEGIPRQYAQDLAVWIFVGGLLGARIVFMIQNQVPIWDFYKIWEGGLVFYGSAMGGVAAFFLAYYLIIRKHNLSILQLCDIMAPAVALGLSMGRIGCLLNGCCYGHVACADCPSIHFPLSAPARFTLTARGYQTAAGFSFDDRDPTGRTVGAVEPDSPAATVGGLQAGDVIVEIVTDKPHAVHRYDDLWLYMVPKWPRGMTGLELTVQRAGESLTLPAFYPRTLGLHPTQVYETISAALIFLLLLAYEPFRKRHGELVVILMLTYPVHRFIDECLRDDTDKVAFGMTLSQNISIVLFVAGLVLGGWIMRKPPEPAPTPVTTEPAPVPAQA